MSQPALPFDLNTYGMGLPPLWICNYLSAGIDFWRQNKINPRQDASKEHFAYFKYPVFVYGWWRQAWF